jgi:recombination protein RecA
MSQALRKLTGSVSRSKCMLVFLNQIRMKIGVMFGNPETTTGGNALKFYASVRMEIRRIGQIKERDEVVGNQTRVKVVKNKLAPPFRQVEFDIMYGEGISKVGELIDLGVKAGVVEKSGAWFSYDSQRIGQGRENAKQFLRDHPEVSDPIEHKIREQSGVVANAMMATADEAEEAEAAE